MKLNNKEYTDILKFYKIDAVKMTRKAIKEKAEHLLATKLCKCIKSVKRQNRSTTQEQRAKQEQRVKQEQRAIAICTNSVIKRKGLKTFRFRCKKGAKLLPKKGSRKLVVITSKNANIK